jgi:hypothetical protein
MNKNKYVIMATQIGFNLMPLFVIRLSIIVIFKLSIWYINFWFNHYIKHDENYFKTIRKIKSNKFCPKVVLTSYEDYSIHPNLYLD